MSAPLLDDTRPAGQTRTTVPDDEFNALTREYEALWGDNMPAAFYLAKAGDAGMAAAETMAAWPWMLKRRRKQVTPWDDPRWQFMLHLGARGTGKNAWLSESCEEAVRHRGVTSVGVVSRTFADAKRIVLRGKTGIFKAGPSDMPRARFVEGSAEHEIEWPGTEARGFVYTAEQPRSPLGAYHDLWICDQPESWRRTLGDHFIEFMVGTLREPRPSGERPRVLLAANAYSSEAVDLIIDDPETIVASESVYENAANLAPGYVETLERIHEGTPFFEAEVLGKLVREPVGALFSKAHIARAHNDVQPIEIGKADRVVIGVDPAGDDKDHSDYSALTAGGAIGRERVWLWEHQQVRELPEQVLNRAAMLWDRYGGEVVIEDNYGKKWVTQRMRDKFPHIPSRGLTHKTSKHDRYRSMSALYGEGKVGHPVGEHGEPLLRELETQMLRYPAIKHDDGLDSASIVIDQLIGAATHHFIMRIA